MHKLAFHRQFYFSPLHQEFVSGKSWDLQLRQAAEKASQSFLWLWQWLSGITLGGNATLMLHDSCSSRWHRKAQGMSYLVPLAGRELHRQWVCPEPMASGTLTWSLKARRGLSFTWKMLVVVGIPLGPLWFTLCLNTPLDISLIHIIL